MAQLFVDARKPRITVENGDVGACQPHPQDLSGKLIGHRIVLVVRGDVVVPAHFELLPVNRAEPIGRQGL